MCAFTPAQALRLRPPKGKVIGRRAPWSNGSRPNTMRNRSFAPEVVADRVNNYRFVLQSRLAARRSVTGRTDQNDHCKFAPRLRSYAFMKVPAARIHIDRVARRDRRHCRLDLSLAAGGAVGARGRAPLAMCQQSQAGRLGDACLSRRSRLAPARQERVLLGHVACVRVATIWNNSALYNAWNSCGTNAVGAPANFDLDLRYFGVANQTVTSTFISVYLCPSDRTNAPITATTGSKTYACTSQNYAVNFGNTLVIQTDFQDIVFGGAPFVDIGSPNADHDQSGRPTAGFNAFLDGLSNTMLASEVIVGQGQDLRGFSWWGDAATFETFLAPNSSFPDVMFSPFYCINQPPNPPCIGTTTALPDNYGGTEPTPRGRERCDGRRFGTLC